MNSIKHYLQNQNNKKLLIVFPHPDDETVMTAGLIQEALSQDWQVKVICVTNGVLGRVHIHGQGRSVVQIRRAELTEAMKILGLTDFEMWRYCDGLMAEFDIWQQQLGETIHSYQPGVVISYGPDGVSGHPDHLTLGKWLWQHWRQSPNYDLLWPSFTGQIKDFLQQHSLTVGRIPEPEYQLKLRDSFVTAKAQAFAAHQSQNLDHPQEWLKQDPTEYFARPKPNQNYNFDLVEFDLGI